MPGVNGDFLASFRQLPLHVIEHIISYLGMKDIKSCFYVNKAWNRLFTSEDSYIWTIICKRKMDREVMDSNLIASLGSYRARYRAYCHAWSSNLSSKNIRVLNNGFVFHRRPVGQSTDICKGKLGFRSGRHCWEIIWYGPVGTVAMVGVSTRYSPVHCRGYLPLLGIDDKSWGWNLVSSSLLHNNEDCGDYPHLEEQKFKVGEKILVILDCDRGTLTFEKENEYLGIAFSDLPKRPLYPTVSTVYGKSRVAILYKGTPPRDG